MARREGLIHRLTHGPAGVGLLLMLAAVATLIATRGCDDQASAGVDSVKLDDQWFHLELALDPVTRFKGLSGRTHIEPDGGMLFAFPRPMENLDFVMRDCPIPIDIIYLDASARITAMHAMLPEPPRTDAEKALDPVTGTNEAYEARLKRYPSAFAAQFVIELAGGTLKTLDLKPGQKVELNTADLKSRAK